MSSNNLKVFFGTPLWFFKLQNHSAVNRQLIKAIQIEQKSDSGVKLSNRGGWQSRGDLYQRPKFKVLVDHIEQNLIQVGKEYGFGDATDQLKITAMWANVNPPGSSNAMHQHQSPVGMPSPLILSGSYYLKIPVFSGDFYIEDIDRPLRYLQLPFQVSNTINTHKILLPPKEGDLLFFPAWMEHGVEENKSNESRISIAFNVALVNRKRK